MNVQIFPEITSGDLLGIFLMLLILTYIFIDGRRR